MEDKQIKEDEKKDKELIISNLNKVQKRIKKNFPIFSALSVVIFTIFMWTIRSLWYSYEMGEFSVYKIDKSYIDALSGNIMLQLIQLFSIVAIWIFINYIFYYIWKSVDKSRFHFKKIGKILLIVFFELFVLIIIIVAQTYKSFATLIIALKNSTGQDIFKVIILLLILCLAINILGMQLMVMNYLDRKEIKKSKNELTIPNVKKENMYKTSLGIIMVYIIVFSIAMGFMYYAGIQTVNTRTDYKVIINETKPEIIDSKEYIFKLNNMKNEVELFPVIYENQNVYILSIFYKENNKLKINFDYQKVIGKNNIDTWNIEEIKSSIITMN